MAAHIDGLGSSSTVLTLPLRSTFNTPEYPQGCPLRVKPPIQILLLSAAQSMPTPAVGPVTGRAKRGSHCST